MARWRCCPGPGIVHTFLVLQGRHEISNNSQHSSQLYSYSTTPHQIFKFYSYSVSTELYWKSVLIHRSNSGDPCFLCHCSAVPCSKVGYLEWYWAEVTWRYVARQTLFVFCNYDTELWHTTARSRYYKQFEVPLLLCLETRTFHKHNDNVLLHYVSAIFFVSTLPLILLTILKWP